MLISIKKISLFIILLSLFSCKSITTIEQSNVSYPEWSKNAVMYELNIRQFSKEGTFNAAEKQLQRLKDLGVDIIWLMPVTPIGDIERKGSLGSYYSVKDYKSVNPEFGTISDFKKFVLTAHSLGLKVITDWVANHTSRDATWISNKDWYIMDSTGLKPLAPFDWTDVAKLNYNNEDMRKAMIDAMKFWISEVDIDGFRCDVAAEVPVDFWDIATKELRRLKSDIYILAEAEKADLLINSFNSYYAWNLHHIMNKISQGKANADTLRRYFKNSYSKFPSNSTPLNFTSNHDENSWNGTEFERMGDYAKQMAVFTFLMPGMPLIYNGQEVAFDRRLSFFEKDSISWSGDTSFTELYKALSKLKKDNPALDSPLKGKMEELPTNNPSDVYVIQYIRDNNTVLALFNFSKNSLIVKIKENLQKGEFRSLQDTSSIKLDLNSEINLPPTGYKVYYK